MHKARSVVVVVVGGVGKSGVSFFNAFCVLFLFFFVQNRSGPIRKKKKETEKQNAVVFSVSC
jgi:hypothetical protein